MLLPQITRIIPRTSQMFRAASRVIVILIIMSGLIFYLVNSGETTKNKSLSRAQNDPQNVNLRLLRAIDLENQNKIDEARGQVMSALNFDPTNPYATDFYNKIAANSTNLDREIKNTLKILRVRPDYQKAWDKLATLYDFEGKTDLANGARQKADELAKKL